MKKAFLLVCILSISVICTACINSFAVQELNNKAMEFIDEGNYAAAIERLKSSIDLDDSVFESHYNLAVAYTKSEDYISAMKEYKKAISLRPDFADCYYSLGVTEENLASDLSAGIIRLDKEGNLVKPEVTETEEDKEKAPETKLTDAEKIYVDDLLKDAINNYNLYLTKATEPEDADEVRNHISDLEVKVQPGSDIVE